MSGKKKVTRKPAEMPQTRAAPKTLLGKFAVVWRVSLIPGPFTTFNSREQPEKSLPSRKPLEPQLLSC